MSSRESSKHLFHSCFYFCGDGKGDEQKGGAYSLLYGVSGHGVGRMRMTTTTEHLSPTTGLRWTLPFLEGRDQTVPLVPPGPQEAWLNAW